MAEETNNLRETPRTEVDDAMLARILRCDRLTVRKYTRAGIIRRERNKKYLLFQTIGDVVEYLRQMASRMGTGDAMKAGAALKDAQRRLTETKLAKLNGDLLSMPEIEALWGDMAASAKWLFLALPVRIRMECNIDTELEEHIQLICAAMLRQVAFSGQMQLPSAERVADDLDDDDDSGEDTAGTEQ